MAKVSILVPRLSHTVIPRCLDSIYQVSAMGHCKSVMFQEGTLLADLRNNLVKMFLATDNDYALLLDSDMIFPPNLIELMVKTAKRNDIKILSGLYFNKNKPDPTPLISTYYGNNLFLPMSAEVLKFLNGKQITSLYIDAKDEESLVKIDGAGAGCLLVHRSVFETVPQPWFSFERPYSEDYYFFMKAKENGFQAYADLRILPEHVMIDSVSIKDYVIANPKDEIEFRLKLANLLVTVASEILDKPKKEIGDLIPMSAQLALEEYKKGNNFFDSEYGIYDLIGWNISANYSKLLRLVYSAARELSGSTLPILCFGSGLGVDALFLKRHGVNTIYYYDKSELFNKFAKNLFEKENVDIIVIKNIEEIGKVCGIIALDVFEHIEPVELSKVLNTLTSKLVSGGLLVEHTPGPDPMHPFHYTHDMSKFLGSKYIRIGDCLWRKK